ncbi:MAG: hypothetical protein AAF745_19340 [Planctomycetota bacterium]
MPTTINGIGTSYYFKKNKRSYEGTCDSCQRHTTLSDYETGYFFVVLYIPIIPLGKKQILRDCPVCRRHQVMPLKQWEKLREESLDSGMNDLAENMNDPSKAIELLGRMTLFNQMEEAFELASATAKQHDQDFQTQIDVGAWYEQQGKTGSAEACFQRAIELEPDNPISKRILGFNALEAKNPVEAAKHFQTLRESVTAYEPSLFFTLANAYQTKEMHAEALEEYQDLLERNPEIGKDKSFRKAVKKSEKALGNPTSILPKKGLFG